MDDEGAPPPRLANGRFAAGNPGRKLGSRNLVTKRLVMTILADFERHADIILMQLRGAYPQAYARLIARFLPPDAAQDLGGEELAELPTSELMRALGTAGGRQARGAAGFAEAEEALLRELWFSRLTAAAEARICGESTVGNGNRAEEEGPDPTP